MKQTDSVVSFDNSRRIALQDKAQAGNIEAQYQLGNSYCCGDSGFWDTKQAVYWWCQAAKQGHADAQVRLDALKAQCP